MKHFYLLTIIFISMPLCKAMDDSNKANIMTELTTTKKPCFAQYLTHDRAVIGREEDAWGDRCGTIFKKILVLIVNPENNEIIKEIIRGDYKYYFNPIHLAVHPNKQKFAVSFANMVTIYNSETGKKEWCTVTRKDINTSTFSPIENTIVLVCNDYSKKNKGTTIVKYNYVADQEYTIYDDRLLRPTIALHPTQPVIYAGNSKGDVFFYEPKKHTRIIKTGYTHDYHYNHDGSIVIAHAKQQIYVMDPAKAIVMNCNYCAALSPDNPILMILNSKCTAMIGKNIDPCLKTLNKYGDNVLSKYCPNCGIAIEKDCYPHTIIDSYFEKVIFYPQSPILVILLNVRHHDKNVYSIKYWDIQTQKCIHTTPILETERNFDTDPVDLSFSPDKTKLLVTFKERCVVVPVPTDLS